MIYKIPNRFEQEERIYLPAYLIGFEHFIYVNLDEPIDDADFANWTVGLFDLSGTEVQNLGAPSKDIISGIDYRFYYTMNIDPENGGKKFIAIYNTVDSVVKYQSNPIWVITTNEEVEEYLFLTYRNSTNRDNFNYVTFPTKSNTVFLMVNEIGNQFEYEKKQYREQSTGKFREQQSQRNKRIELETYLFDEGANDAMGSLSDHDTIALNGEDVTVKEGHQHENNRDFNLSKGQIVFYIPRYATTNLNG